MRGAWLSGPPKKEEKFSLFEKFPTWGGSEKKTKNLPCTHVFAPLSLSDAHNKMGISPIYVHTKNHHPNSNHHEENGEKHPVHAPFWVNACTNFPSFHPKRLR